MSAHSTHSTHVVTHHPVRSDLTEPDPAAPRRPVSSRWALTGLAAGVTGMITVASSMMVNAVYDQELDGDPTLIADKLADQVPQMLVFHVAGMVTSVLLLVFAAGAYRRLRATAPADSLAPAVAAFGLLGTAFVLLVGTGLDTEFIFAVGNEDIATAENSTFYNHWIGTVPWCWGLMGVAGIALFVLARSGGVPRWLGIVGLVGGGITLLFGISPLQYMAGMTGPIGLVVVSLGFLVGDKAFRRA